MSKLRTPPDKKRAAYARDHRTDMEAPHAFRKNWPKKKALINRKRRRVGDRTLRTVLKGFDSEGVVIPSRVRGEHLHKMGVASLAEAVRDRANRRRTDFLPRYIGRAYRPDLHRVAFGHFLRSLVRGRSELAQQRAAYFSWLLDWPLPNNSPVAYERKWLQAFFLDQPQWERRVREWIGGLQHEAS